ncbi:hypothetical protein [Paucidesulfovibrio longus]|uniref:hypothetical protein n=1 Tax=Paucidesulfovibrio longus TaxID=889 RepID=UPI0003B7284D|nr:hypothetical protein [Paucidesulfovibrio longus]
MNIGKTARRLFNGHYETMATDHCNTCHVGTWFINRQQHLAEEAGGFKLKTLFDRFRNKGRASATKKAATPAAARTATQTVAAPRAACKILVVSKGTSFSNEVMEYAIDMASKTRSSLVALNLDENGHNFSQFENTCASNIDGFSCRAAEAGLRFNHLVRSGAEDHVVADLHKEDSEFRYVMNDVVSESSTSRSIPVYTRATLRVR